MRLQEIHVIINVIIVSQILDEASCFQSRQGDSPRVEVLPPGTAVEDPLESRDTSGQLPLCRTVLTQNMTGPTLGDREPAAHMINAGTAASGAQKFPFAASV